jgi:RNA polymerase sigma-70 factor (ECF subfamily)
MEAEGTEIARGLRRRDPELLDRLIVQYQHRLFRYLLHFTGDSQLSEDIFQETWLRVLERGAQYDSRYKFEAWLISIARNLVLDRARRKNPRLFSEMAREDEPEFVTAIADERAPSPFDAAAQAQLQAQLGSAMGSLEPIFREVLTLRFQEGLHLNEIAQAIGIPAATVKSRLYRALTKLEQKIKGRGHE